jgi:Protein of unknown function (DUF4089)
MEEDEAIDAIVDAMARMLDLPLPEGSRPVVIANLRIARDMARVVESFPLDDEAEPAPVFTP